MKISCKPIVENNYCPVKKYNKAIKILANNNNNNIESYSTLDKLIYANKEGIIQTGQNLKQIVTHPVKTAGAIAKQIGNTFIHPFDTTKNINNKFKQDKIDGIIQAGGTFTTVAGIGSIVLGIGAYVAAPFTSGASLALIPIASAIGTYASTAGLSLMGASFAKNQVDAVTAKTMDELKKESKELAGDYTGAVIAGTSYAVIKGITYALNKTVIARRITPSALERVNRRYENKWLKDKISSDSSPKDINTVFSNRHRTVIKIKEINNMASDSETIRLYHGTNNESAEAIVKTGFHVGDVGDYGPGNYMTNNPTTALNYADDASYCYNLRTGANTQPAILVSKVKVGKVFDFNLNKEHFLNWAKSNFNPEDLTDEINVIYQNTKTALSPIMDTTWNRYLPRYMKEFGYDSILIKAQEGAGYDYWVIPDAKQINVTQEIILNTPPNKVNPIAPTIAGAIRTGEQQ